VGSQHWACNDGTAVKRHGQVVAAAKDLHCSEAYIWKQFKLMGITLAQVLES